MNNQPVPNSQEILELNIAQERLRQARYSFNLALIATAVSFCVSFVGAILLLSGKVSGGIVTSLGGLISSAKYLKVAKEFDDRL
ncbi:hypothetical protein PCC7424_3696 [Gloeothece citriformis PCC 7424]|uniref:Cyanobacterial TRADD-N associated 2 transmembrane domain-containing protein n=1 Tax=Gloeothece citriformis (strain PCC 7424) TaxID=65393 RepID=B7KHY0_GLOC7|nr:hypothetical protein [Gloeothece citriformis]ACK72077.1 hypothetical protein PCC7424_3696 [Gloeothece citriformis PCC 7424]